MEGDVLGVPVCSAAEKIADAIRAFAVAGYAA
jgi:hypothetical protein